MRVEDHLGQNAAIVIYKPLAQLGTREASIPHGPRGMKILRQPREPSATLGTQMVRSLR